MGRNLAKYFLLLSFIEGATVMGAELLGAKMLAPYFGSSLYVWSTVMAITLGGLALGYFFGGRLSNRNNSEIILYKVLLLASLFTVLMPYTSKMALYFFGLRSLLPAVVISSLFILLPPVFLMGAVSPLIIGNISKNGIDSGRAAGTVYAVSTVGGIISTFLFGFYLIPTFGLTFPAIFSGIFLSLLPLISLVKKKEFNSLVLFGVIVFASLFQLYKHSEVAIKENGVVVYKEEGLLGQILVVDYINDSISNQKSRWLYVNGISQTKENAFARKELGEEKYFTYVFKFSELLSSLPSDNREVLLLGLGGGSIVKHLTENNFNVEVCELDERIYSVAQEYFELPKKTKVTIDDARHFIKKAKKRYDVIIFDTFKGEETPSHILTQESLFEIKKMLNPGGYVLINSFNYIKGEKGLGLQSIYKTLLASGFKTQVWSTNEDIYDRNLLFIASLNEVPFKKEYIDMNQIDLSNARILKDEYPAFEILNGLASLDWRRNAIQNNSY